MPSRFLCCLLLYMFYSGAGFGQQPAMSPGDSITIRSMLERGRDLMRKTDPACLPALDSVLQLSAHKEQTYYRKAHVHALHAKANYYITLQKFATAKTLLTQQLNEATKFNFNTSVLAAKLNLGLVAKNKSNYEEAIRLYLDALSYSEHIKDTGSAALAYYNVGNIYILTRQTEKSIAALIKAGEIFKQTNNKLGMANCISGLSVAYGIAGNNEKVLEMKLEAYRRFKELGAKKNMSSIQSGLGRYYEEHGQPDKALKHYDTSLMISWQLGTTAGFGDLYGNLGEVYIKLKDTARSMICADSALYYGKKEGNRKGYLAGLNLKERVLNMQSHFKEAYDTLRTFIILKDSIYNENMQQSIADMEVKYETEKKQNQILSLTKDNTIQSLQLNNQNLALAARNYLISEQLLKLANDSLELRSKNESILRHRQEYTLKEKEVLYLNQQARIRQLELDKNKLEVARKNQVLALLIATLLLLSVAAYMYYRRFRSRKEEQLRTVLAAQQQLATKALFEGEQNERMRIARDLHDSIGQMLSVVKMQLSGLRFKDEPQQNNVLQTQDLLDKTIEEVRHISHNLIPEELNFGIVSALEELCSRINNTEGTKVHLSVNEAVKNYGFSKPFELSLYRIVQEILNNMLKHANASAIHIGMLREEQSILLDIRDDGKGFDTADIAASKGIGWKNIFARVNLLNGKMDIRSEKIKGTQIQIMLPQ